MTGDFDAALSSYEEACADSEESGADRELAWAQVGLGYVRLRLGDIEAGTALLDAADARMPWDDAMGRGLMSFIWAALLTAAGNAPRDRHGCSPLRRASNQDRRARR